MIKRRNLHEQQITSTILERKVTSRCTKATINKNVFTIYQFITSGGLHI